MDKKIIFFDCDGTILNKNYISRRTLYTFQRLKDKGHILILSTGRALPIIQDILKQLPIDNVICSAGGCVIIDRKIIWENYFSYEQLKEIIDYFDKYGMIYNLECNDYVYIQKGSRERHLKRIQFLNQGEISMKELSQKFDEKYVESDNLEQLKVNKIHWFEDTVLYDHHELLNYDLISKKFKDRYHVIPLLGNKLSIGGEISKKGITKQKGLKIILDYFQINRDNIYAIGDDMNDKEMLEYATHAIAMGQAPEEIKNICEYVTEDVEHDGFSKAMEHFNLID